MPEARRISGRKVQKYVIHITGERRKTKHKNGSTELQASSQTNLSEVSNIIRLCYPTEIKRNKESTQVSSKPALNGHYYRPFTCRQDFFVVRLPSSTVFCCSAKLIWKCPSSDVHISTRLGIGGINRGDLGPDGNERGNERSAEHRC